MGTASPSEQGTELSRRYDPSGLERPLYESWKRAGLFHVEAADAERPFVIVIPPPNVTSALHMGHGLNNTIQDVLIRWRRMQGYDAVWIPGTDHAGIATQNVVERQLADEGKSRFDLGRERFVARVWQWVEQYGGRILEQLEAIGCSCDWERTRFTFDEGLSRAVREVFVRLHDKGLVYRARYIINWCPRCGTALSNEEAEHQEHEGTLWWIRYPLADDPERHVEVATTRPETMLGDTALAIHPDDERYRDLVGREAVLPLVGRRLPIVADEHVDPAFGSGVVKVTPAHDPNDFEIGRRHGLESIDVLTDAAAISEAAPERFRGLDRVAARERIVEELEREGRLVRSEPYVHAVAHCYRCGTVVEPRLSLQWFVRMKPLAEPALAAYREGRLRFHPERYGKVYEHWMENIRDWCISRQIWWGHRIPVWYCRDGGCGEMIVARVEPAACAACGGPVEQDEDVLDTWFSSWLWPFSTLGWPEETEDLRVFYPTTVLSTAPEILFFWVARMVMAGLEFRGELPFADVLLHSTVRDPLNRKMSKSLGNGIDPLEVVARFGADAMRWTVISKASLGTDFQLDPNDLEESFRPGRNFANKIWNAARFLLPHLEEGAGESGPYEAPEGRSEALADRWIRSRFHHTETAVTGALEAFRLHDAAERLHGFVWGDFCDWYLELIKGRLDGAEGEAARRAAVRTAAEVLLGWLRLLHPIMPFITEEIARRLPGRSEGSTLVLGPWTSASPAWADPDGEAAMAALQELVGTVRALRSEYHVDPARPLRLRIGALPSALDRALADEATSARRLAGLAEIEVGGHGDGTEPGAHAVLRSGAELFIPLRGVIDLDRERARIRDESERVRGLLERARMKLENEGFTANAPPEVVEREGEKARSLADQHARLEEKLRSLGVGD